MEATNNHWWNPAQSLNRLLLSPTLARRGLAMMLDLAIVSALQLGISQIFGVYHMFPDSTTNTVINGDGYSFSSSQLATIPYLWLAVIIVAYLTIFEALFGATPGKGLLRLHVVSLDGRRLTLRATFVRNLFRFVDALPLLYIVGCLVAQSTLHEQRVGDILANTTVTPIGPRDTGDSSAQRMTLKLLLLGIILAALVGGAGAFQYYERGPLVIQSWVNMNNYYGSSASSVPVCGPLHQAPFAVAPAASTLSLDAPGSIMQYAIGAPLWGRAS